MPTDEAESEDADAESEDADAESEESESGISPNLSQEIWCLLPDDAIERVMLRLPLLSLLKVRCVCKSWESSISSQTFTDLYNTSSKQNPWLLIFPHNNDNHVSTVGLAYDPSSRRWFDIPFKFLPFESKIVATGEGLLCMIPHGKHHNTDWIACNPISKAWRIIPSPPGLLKLFFLVVGLFVDRNHGVADKRFQVVMAGSELVADDSDSFILVTQVYDSMRGTWQKGGSMLLDVPLSPWKATCQAVLYCVTGSPPYRVLAYDVKQSAWSQVSARMPDHLMSVRLIDHHGKLLMIGGVGQTEDGTTTTTTIRIGIWELDLTRTTWTQHRWMPDQYCNDLLRSLSRRFVCIGQGNFLFFGNKRCNGILEHNLHAKSWRWIPLNSLFINIHYNMLRGFHFQPSL